LLQSVLLNKVLEKRSVMEKKKRDAGQGEKPVFRPA